MALRRTLLVAFVLIVAVLCLASTLIAAVIGGLTLVAVVLDVIAHHPTPVVIEHDAPAKLVVDLSARTGLSARTRPRASARSLGLARASLGLSARTRR